MSESIEPTLKDVLSRAFDGWHFTPAQKEEAFADVEEVARTMTLQKLVARLPEEERTHLKKLISESGNSGEKAQQLASFLEKAYAPDIIQDIATDAYREAAESYLTEMEK